jgi:tellurite resistance protein
MFTVLAPILLHMRFNATFHTAWWAVSFPLAATTNAALKFSVHQPSWPAQAFALAMLALTTLVILSMSVRTIAGILRGELRALTV